VRRGAPERRSPRGLPAGTGACRGVGPFAPGERNARAPLRDGRRGSPAVRPCGRPDRSRLRAEATGDVPERSLRAGPPGRGSNEQDEARGNGKDASSSCPKSRPGCRSDRAAQSKQRAPGERQGAQDRPAEEGTGPPSTRRGSSEGRPPRPEARHSEPAGGGIPPAGGTDQPGNDDRPHESVSRRPPRPDDALDRRTRRHRRHAESPAGGSLRAGGEHEAWNDHPPGESVSHGPPHPDDEHERRPRCHGRHAEPATQTSAQRPPPGGGLPRGGRGLRRPSLCSRELLPHRTPSSASNTDQFPRSCPW
jgi:hypothetical protein